MTCRELYMKQYPGRCNYLSQCPGEYGYLPDPDYCGDGGGENTCERCWNREVPGETQEEAVARVVEAFDDAMGRPSSSIPQILDSGDRTQFKTGDVRDMREGKGRCDLMPLEVVSKILAPDGDISGSDLVIGNIALFKNKGYSNTIYLYRAMYYFSETYNSLPGMFLEVAKHFEEGAKKYGENNWQKGIPVHCYIDSAVRHYLKWKRGDNEEPHDRAFVWNIMCCIWEVDYHKSEEEDHATN